MHSLFLTSNGILYGVGNNTEGELRNAAAYDTVSRPIKLAVKNVMNLSACYYTLCVDINRNVYIFGSGTVLDIGLSKNIQTKIDSSESIIEQPTLIANMQDIISVSVGINHSLCLSGYGNVYTFGINDHGQLEIYMMNFMYLLQLML